MTDGTVNKCKDCNKKDVRENRHRRSDYYRDYDRKRGSRQTVDYRVKYRKQNPDKYRAHNALNNAVRDGKITKMDCEKCGRVDTHGHHDDYAKPLEVRWLCPPCHAEEHPRF
jgi:transposase-like protein